jgi:succinyldiaminopimelate transaminase
MLTELPEYPWDAMAPYVAKAKAHPGGAIDLSIGSPVDPTPAVIRDALARATDSHAYPTTMGTPALREAIVAWFARRRGVSGLGVENVLPTIGSKEFVAWLPFMLRLGPGDVVVHPTVAYPTYDIGARMAEATPFPSDDPAEWPEDTKLVWLNSPGNPDGRVLDKAQLKARVDRARELGAYIVGDECYAELGWSGPWENEPIPSLLDPEVTGGDLTGILTAYSLSKQSNLAGYRAAFVAGDARLIAQLTNIRKHAGMMQPGPVQAAMVVALSDDAHVAAQKELYRARRNQLIPALNSAGYRVDHSEAGLYLWVTEGLDAWSSIDKLASLGIIAGPGVFYGDFYPQHVRLSLTETDERIAEAARRLLSV